MLDEEKDNQNIDSIIEKHQQIYLKLKSREHFEIESVYSDILNELKCKYNSQISLYQLKSIEGLLIDYSQLNNEEKENFKQYLTNISKKENIELVIEGLHHISY